MLSSKFRPEFLILKAQFVQERQLKLEERVESSIDWNVRTAGLPRMGLPDIPVLAGQR